MPIENLQEFRLDEQAIKRMSAEELAAFGPVQKVIAVGWDNDGKAVRLESVSGLHVKIAPDRNAVLVLKGFSEVLIYNADGSLRLQVPNVQALPQGGTLGDFLWFESPRVDHPHAFGVVFEPSSRKDGMYRLDIDSLTGETLDIAKLR